MHQAYELVTIVEKLPLDIESIESYEDNLLVGTKQGHLLLYLVSKNPATNKYEVSLKKSIKSFAKRPISQISVALEFNLLIILSDNLISVHDNAAAAFPLITTLQKTRGATLFSTDIRENSQGKRCLYLGVTVKKKVQIYEWTKDGFKDIGIDLCVPDIPKAMAWCGEALYIGFKAEYSLIKMNGEQVELFPTGRKPVPLIVNIDEAQVALGRDEQFIFIDKEGRPTSKFALVWSEAPIAAVQDYPYIIALLKSSIEIKTKWDPKLQIQTISVSNLKYINRCSSGKVYVATNSSVWCLNFYPILEQIKSLQESEDFELALKLGKMIANSAEGDAKFNGIQSHYGFHLFNKKKFGDALKVFKKLRTDTVQVIGLFPKLLSEKQVCNIEYPGILVPFEGNELEVGIVALSEFLTDVRTELLAAKTKMEKEKKSPIEIDKLIMCDIIKGQEKILKRSQILQIIDTALLKCYLMTTDALVAPFLRVKNNYCNLEEAERALKQNKKYSELIILYQSKGQHKKALEFLMKHSTRSDSPLRGHERTIQYLQHLGPLHFDLIQEFSKWILLENPEDGVTIFTKDLSETEALPRDKVLNLLNDIQPVCVIPYLEHIINEWGEKESHYHNHLIHCYLEQLAQQQEENPERTEFEVKTNLIKFLRTSTYYKQEAFPFKLFNTGLYEEAAIVMEKLHSHEEALGVYVNQLKQLEVAEEYCVSNYNCSNQRDRDVFVILLKLYLGKQEKCQLNPNVTPEPNFAAAVDLLNKYSSFMDPLKTLQILPNFMLVGDIKDFFKHILQNSNSKLHKTTLLRSLKMADNLQVQGYRLKQNSVKIILTEADLCKVCQKKLGKSAFVRFPDGTLCHYSCREVYESSAQNTI